jgi:hypothetical protein
MKTRTKFFLNKEYAMHYTYSKLRGVLLLLAAVFSLSLTACPMEDTDDGGDEGDTTLSFTGGSGELELTIKDGTARFFSLASGKEITEKKDMESQGWDIAFYATRYILTNSGITAGKYFSGGKGGVFHTNQTDFDAVTGKEAMITGPDPVDGRDYGVYNQDVRRYANGMGGGGEAERTMNVMTYLGYEAEDQDAHNGLTYGTMFTTYYTYERKQFYANTFTNGFMTMPPEFYVTNQVYIIKHGDGEHYSKFQVTQFTRNFGSSALKGVSDTFKVRWKNLE